ncbi:MAG: hypothetical protein ABIL58_22520 [Pseudomonadota bacterium]
MTNHRSCRIMITAAMGILIACAPAALHLPPGDDTINKIEAGMEEKTVRLLAGEPDRVEPTPYSAHILYYRESLVSDCTKDLTSCIPIVVADGQVAAVGHQWMNAWENDQKAAAAEQSRRLREATASAQQVKKEAPLRLNGNAADHQPDEATRAQIARLENQARRIPVSRTTDNLNIYRYLHKLDPENPKYIRKMAYYEAQLERDQQIQAEAKRQAAEQRRLQNAALKSFEGNVRARMAIENLGGGKFHVWIENRLTAPIRVTPRHFTLVCTNNARFAVYQSKDFNDTVAPGKVIDGRLAFDAYCPAREMIFTHPATGRITRVFPPQDPVPPAPSTP